MTNSKVTFRLTSEYIHLKGHSSKNILQLPRVGVEGRSERGKLVNSRRTVKITQTITIDWLANEETKGSHPERKVQFFLTFPCSKVML